MRRLFALAVAAILMSYAPGVEAAPGDLDPTFDFDGRVTTDFFSEGAGASAVVLQPDGKIVAAGLAFNSSTGEDFALARYNTDGSLDASFGTGGKVTTDFFSGNVGGNGDGVAGVVLQPDGKIVAAGAHFKGGTGTDLLDFALARYNTDGSLDTSFGTGGNVTTDFFGSDDIANAIVLQPDGKIVAAGFPGLARYNTDGSLDTSFGSGGKVNGDMGTFGVVLQPDGKIVAAGSSSTQGGLFLFALARYLSGETVVIDGCDTGVADQTLTDGSTISNRIASCAAGTRNHGQFVSCVSRLTNELKHAGIIAGRQKGAIQNCAAQADIP